MLFRPNRVAGGFSPPAPTPPGMRVRTGRSLAVPPLPSASICVNVSIALTGFTYRGLSPHKFTPVPGAGYRRIKEEHHGYSGTNNILHVVYNHERNLVGPLDHNIDIGPGFAIPYAE
ncbi:MAG: hypothetical protein WC560_10535 [Syntrophales bacterium]